LSRFIVGLTGGIGSGKSTVADLFVAQGIALVDTDSIAHELTAPEGAAMPAIIAAFGPAIADAQGALNRVAMRQRVFADAAERTRLEAILHPRIRQIALSRCQAANSPYVILAVPLLLEAGTYQCDRILVVDCPESIQIQRVMARNQLDETAVRAILAAQASRQARLAIADDVILNDGSAAALAPAVEKLHRNYLARALKKPQAKC
jgi:dephospho-CoA kinase